MKLGTVAASLGGASAASAAAGGYYLYSKDTSVSIREALKDSKLISTLSGEALTKQWQEEFKSAKDDIKRNIKDLKDVTAEDDGGKKLESWCLKQMDLDSKKHSETLELVKKYCLIRSVSSQLSRTGNHLLGDGEEEKWKATYAKRKNKQTSRTGVGLGDSWQGEQENQDLPKVKVWCSENKDRDFLATEDLYTKLLQWCTTEGANVE